MRRSEELEQLRCEIASQEKCVNFFRERKLKRERLSAMIKKFCACVHLDELENREQTCKNVNVALKVENCEEVDVETEKEMKQIVHESEDEHSCKECKQVSECKEDSTYKNKEESETALVNSVSYKKKEDEQKQNNNTIDTEEKAKTEITNAVLEEEEQVLEEEWEFHDELREIQELMQSLMNEGDCLERIIDTIHHRLETEQASKVEMEEVNEISSDSESWRNEDFDPFSNVNSITSDHIVSNNKYNNINVRDKISLTDKELAREEENALCEINESDTLNLESKCVLNKANLETNRENITQAENAALMLALNSFTFIEPEVNACSSTNNVLPSWLMEEGEELNEVISSNCDNSISDNKSTRNNVIGNNNITLTKTHCVSDGDEIDEKENYEDDFDDCNDNDNNNNNIMNLKI